DQVQAAVAARSATSPRAAATSPRPYALRGRLSCGLCRRRLQGQWVRGEAYYRCRYPTEYAHSAGFDHPVNIYLREADLVAKLNASDQVFVTRSSQASRLPSVSSRKPMGDRPST